MDRAAFTQSLLEDDPPLYMSEYLMSLWYDGKENWEKAHEIIQDIDNEKAALIHAYLHRKEGDDRNAGYWYKRAKSKRPSLSIPEEWDQLVDRFL